MGVPHFPASPSAVHLVTHSLWWQAHTFPVSQISHNLSSILAVTYWPCLMVFNWVCKKLSNPDFSSVSDTISVYFPALVSTFSLLLEWRRDLFSERLIPPLKFGFHSPPILMNAILRYPFFFLHPQALVSAWNIMYRITELRKKAEFLATLLSLVSQKLHHRPMASLFTTSHPLLHGAAALFTPVPPLAFSIAVNGIRLVAKPDKKLKSSILDPLP